MKIFRTIRNFFFCLKYPFYKIYNVWTGKFCGYASTWFDFIPTGWRKAFGKQLSIDLREQLKKDEQLKKFRFTDIKEKYGTLRLYCCSATEEVYNILDFYEDLSSDYCVICGKPTKYLLPANLFLCEDCINRPLMKKELAKPIYSNIRISKDKHLTGDQLKDYIHLMRPWQTVEKIEKITEEGNDLEVEYTRKIGEYY